MTMKLVQKRNSRVDVVDLVEPRRGVVRDLRQLHLLAGEPGDHPADDHHEAERAGVDDPGLGEHVELLGRVADRLLAGEQRRRQHLGEQRVLLAVGRRPGRAARAATATRRSATASAIARITVSIVPSAGSRTEA